MHIVQEKTCTKSMTQAQEMCASFWYKILLCVSPLLDTTKHNVTAFSTLVYSVLQISLLAYLKPCLLPDPDTATGETKSDIRASPIYKYTNSNKKKQLPVSHCLHHASENNTLWWIIPSKSLDDRCCNYYGCLVYKLMFMFSEQIYWQKSSKSENDIIKQWGI